MNPEKSPKTIWNLERLLRLAALAGPIWYIAAVTYITLARFTYPYELEWMEGGSLMHLLRLQAGQPLYIAPSLEFTPYIYPPFYYYVAFAISKLTGLMGFTPLRLTSMLASLGIAICVFFLVRNQTGSRYWGFLSVGLFFGAFRAAGAWFDIARVDMLFVFLMMAGWTALFLLDHERKGADIYAGLLFALAFYTKQTSVIVFLVILVFVFLVRRWRAALRLSIAFILPTAVIIIVEMSLSNGWYWYYLFHLPGLHYLVDPFWGQLLVQAINLLQPLAIAAPIGLLRAILEIRSIFKTDWGISLAAISGLIFLGVVAGMNVGSYDNAYVPAFAGFAVLFGLGGAWLQGLLDRPVYKNARVLFYALCLLQFVLMYFNVPSQIPTPADRQAGDQLVALLKNAPGEVLIPYHSYLAELAGKKMYAHHIALQEVEGAFGEKDDAVWEAVKTELQDAIQQKRFSVILLNGKNPMWSVIFENYHPKELEYPTPKAFYPVTGAPTRPDFAWYP